MVEYPTNSMHLVNIPLGLKPLEDSSRLRLKESNPLAISARVAALLNLILVILKGVGMNWCFLFCPNKLNHLFYFLHNSTTKYCFS